MEQFLEHISAPYSFEKMQGEVNYMKEKLEEELEEALEELKISCRVQGYVKGMDVGKYMENQKVKKEIAEKMLKKVMDVETIAEVTGLTTEEVLRLKQ
ncbi:hypothetical protein [Salibacterium qingdaonense]|uniref:Uncharacterized protein n=1 Tax=Salibacterium qingdaonense TaxID=266892 RepID=A0A1I4NSZ4_9BACI|nr:hypothetical protein [Salibacterium qingdaonense]SFM18480.1 conserved hypothetical protein (putative transposase or invertase) [Salibacterium qingdaonense]